MSKNEGICMQQASFSAWRGFMAQIMVFAAIWSVLAGGDLASCLIGAPLVLFVVVANHRLGRLNGRCARLSGVLRFLPYFLIGSFRGGLATATLVLFRGREVQPAMVEYQTTLPPGRARALFVGTIGLLPGTLTADLNGRLLHIHVLDGSMPVTSELRELERRIAAIFLQETG
ncbi:Na+/H+ antiporter subunit E [Ruegeria arenilitoris]|uniref:Na+/H+ antiporter subunit E n=1 Tax=Ruegeria arenilitoris TaxID=1173585 RepID=UPI001C972D6B|nr:Na+/H+ antiporter subunit E [Ruegeria arenilitoris]MBY6082771.1 Na+/H+ antiporter subunit E [Ruegeria arenilitoris]